MALKFLNDGYFAAKVGIGTVSPTEPLTVSKTASGSTTQIASLVNPVGTANTGVRLWMSGTNTTTRGTFIDAVAETTSNDHSLRFGTSASSSTPTERMRITSGGNVGIGTTSPTYKLQVAGKSYLSGGVQLNSGDRIDFGNSQQYITGVNSTSLTLVTGNSATLTALDNGNVGIGTTSPGEKLDLAGTNVGVKINGTQSSRVYYNRSGTYTWSTGLRSGDTKFHIFDERSGDRVVIDDTGNVGIGTTSPSYKLHVKGTVNGNVNIAVENASTGTNAYASYRFKNNSISTAVMFLNGSNNSGYAGASSLNMYQGTNLPLGFVTNNLLRMTVTGAGNVGIGTTSPSGILHVKGSTDDTVVYIDTNNNALGDSAKISFNDRAQVGWIDAAVTLTDGGGNKDIKLKVATGSVFVQTNNTTRLTVADGGNVGIGTTSPGSKLTVNGSFSADTGSFSNELTLSSNLRLQNNITILNKAQSAYISFATRNTTGSEVVMDLTNVGSINGGAAGPYLPLSAGSGFPLTGDLYFSGSHLISSNTADGSDNAQIIISGGGADGDTRGATVHLAGNENGNGGLLQLRAGVGAISQIRSYTSGSERMRITSTGNVGIGTTLPSSKLHVKGDMVTIEDPSAGYKMELSADNNPVTIRSDNRTGASYGSMAFIAGNGSDANDITRMTIDTSGNVGIGQTSPTAKLYVQGDTIVRGVLRGDNVNFGLGGAIKVNASNTASDQYVAFGTTPSGLSLIHI